VISVADLLGRGARSTRTDRAIGAAAANQVLEVAGNVRLTGEPLVVELVPEANVAAGEAPFGLGDALRAHIPDAEVLRFRAAPGRLDLNGRPLVIVARDAHRHPWEREAVDELLAASEGAVVIETGIPEWRPERATGYIATHGAARVNLEAAAARLAAT